MRLLSSVAALALLLTGLAFNPLDSIAKPLNGSDAATFGHPPDRYRETDVLQLQGTAVINRDGEELGRIIKVLRGPDSRLYAVLEFGGYFDIGEEHRLIDLSRIFWMDDSLILPGLTMEQLDTLPKLRADTDSDMALEDAFQVRIGEYPSDRAPDATGSIGTHKDEVEADKGE